MAVHAFGDKVPRIGPDAFVHVDVEQNVIGAFASFLRMTGEDSGDNGRPADAPDTHKPEVLRWRWSPTTSGRSRS